jgi:predicted nucleic acid-binding protein
MNGRSVLLDTNTVLYFLAGDETLSEFIRDKKIYISVISELELLAYNELTQQEIKLIQSFIRDIDIIDISLDIKALSIQLRRQTRLKLPDCIIAATSMVLQLPLITADKGMKQVFGLDLVLYEK